MKNVLCISPERMDSAYVSSLSRLTNLIHLLDMEAGYSEYRGSGI